ncbi:hypothetical protein ACIQTT_01795 [Microbacterium sp. NPDC090225]|uniref:hypothetical protein n=1 Tax=Microbacterium sp. NPDC090225 TaxID=3364207 RepID=UPI00382A89AE
MTETTPTYPSAAVAAALHLIDSGSVPCIDLEEGDVLWQAIPAAVIKPAAWLGERYELNGLIHTALPLDAEGRKVPLPDGPAWCTEVAALPTNVMQYWKSTPNSAIRIGDLLVISLGYMIPSAPVEVDGERFVEMVTPEEARRRDRVAKEEWLAAHPEVRASKPEWAESMAIEWEGYPSEISVLYERVIGAVTISLAGVVEDGRLSFDRDTPDVLVKAGNMCEEIGGLVEMRSLAASLMAAIPVLEEAVVQS